MAYTAGNLVLNASGAPGNINYFYDAVADTMATVFVAGYFNNTDDDLNLTVDDIIMVVAADGDMLMRVSAISSGSVTVQTFGGVGPNNGDVSTGVATATISPGINEIGTGTATGWVTSTPYPGARLLVVFSGTSTAIVTVSSSGVTFNAKGDTDMTFALGGAFVDLLGVSATQWIILGSSAMTLA